MPHVILASAQSCLLIETFSDENKRYPTQSLSICFIFIYSTYRLWIDIMLYTDVFTVGHPHLNASSISFGPCYILRINK